MVVKNQQCDNCGRSLVVSPRMVVKVYGEEVTLCSSQCLLTLVKVWAPSTRQVKWAAVVKYAVMCLVGMVVA